MLISHRTFRWLKADVWGDVWRYAPCGCELYTLYL